MFVGVLLFGGCVCGWVILVSWFVWIVVRLLICLGGWVWVCLFEVL